MLTAIDESRYFLLLKSGAIDDALDILEKAAGHKYIRRIPTGNPKRKYRYVYNASSAAAHPADPKVGEKVKIKHDGKEGHYEITHVHDDGHVSVRHDESGHEMKVHRGHLHDMMRKEHAAAIDEHHAQLTKLVEEAKKHGASEKQIARLTAQLETARRAKGATGAHYVHEGMHRVDSAFVQGAVSKLGGEHLGGGNFIVKTPYGEVNADRTDEDPKSGSGREHALRGSKRAINHVLEALGHDGDAAAAALRKEVERHALDESLKAHGVAANAKTSKEHAAAMDAHDKASYAFRRAADHYRGVDEVKHRDLARQAKIHDEKKEVHHRWVNDLHAAEKKAPPKAAKTSRGRKIPDLAGTRMSAFGTTGSAIDKWNAREHEDAHGHFKAAGEEGLAEFHRMMAYAKRGISSASRGLGGASSDSHREFEMQIKRAQDHLDALKGKKPRPSALDEITPKHAPGRAPRDPSKPMKVPERAWAARPHIIGDKNVSPGTKWYSNGAFIVRDDHAPSIASRFANLDENRVTVSHVDPAMVMPKALSKTVPFTYVGSVTNVSKDSKRAHVYRSADGHVRLVNVDYDPPHTLFAMPVEDTSSGPLVDAQTSSAMRYAVMPIATRDNGSRHVRAALNLPDDATKKDVETALRERGAAPSRKPSARQRRAERPLTGRAAEMAEQRTAARQQPSEFDNMTPAETLDRLGRARSEPDHELNPKDISRKEAERHPTEADGEPVYLNSEHDLTIADVPKGATIRHGRGDETVVYRHLGGGDLKLEYAHPYARRLEQQKHNGLASTIGELATRGHDVRIAEPTDTRTGDLLSFRSKTAEATAHLKGDKTDGMPSELRDVVSRVKADLASVEKQTGEKPNGRVQLYHDLAVKAAEAGDRAEVERALNKFDLEVSRQLGAAEKRKAKAAPSSGGKVDKHEEWMNHRGAKNGIDAGTIASGDGPYKPGDILSHKHDSPETAYVIDDYPYGRQVRTKKRVWIETNDKGQRVHEQTLNPKTNVWNKPKTSTYDFAVALRFDENGHIKHAGSVQPHNLVYLHQGYEDKVKKFYDDHHHALHPKVRDTIKRVLDGVKKSEGANAMTTKRHPAVAPDHDDDRFAGINRLRQRQSEVVVVGREERVEKSIPVERLESYAVSECRKALRASYANALMRLEAANPVVQRVLEKAQPNERPSVPRELLPDLNIGTPSVVDVVAGATALLKSQAATDGALKAGLTHIRVSPASLADMLKTMALTPDRVRAGL